MKINMITYLCFKICCNFSCSNSTYANFVLKIQRAYKTRLVLQYSKKVDQGSSLTNTLKSLLRTRTYPGYCLNCWKRVCILFCLIICIILIWSNMWTQIRRHWFLKLHKWVTMERFLFGVHPYKQRLNFMLLILQ